MTALSPRTVPAVSRRLRARRNSLLFSCAMGASLVLAGQATPARAQAINATPATSGGNVTYNRSTPGIETVTVETQQAIINWTPPAGTTNPYVFLPSGNTVTFQNGVNVSNFAVLNRILTTLPSRFDGTVISQLRDASGNVTGRGGTVVFSSPGGIIVGSTAVFDVGNLVLTSLTVAEDGYGNFLSPNGGFQYELSGDENSGSIITEAGSQINALTGNSYVALVAPQVTHAGSIRVNGSVGFIAAEQVSFSVNEGLFDIQVTTGSGNATPIVHTGSTGGPASTGGTDNHGIYAVAVPKNQAITMLLSGTMGYDAATDVTVENGEIVLSAGYNVGGGQIASSSSSDLAANIAIDGGTFTSDVVGRATGNAIATATAGNPLAFDGSLELQAAGRAELIADAGSTARVDGDLELIAIDAETAAPGDARLEARTGAVVTLGGDVTLSADHFPGIGRIDSFPVNGQSTQGGTATVLAQGGSIAIAGDLNVTASAAGGSGSSTGGNATGGTASVEANGGSVNVTGAVNILSIALGGSSLATSGNGTGGTARLSTLGGSIDIGGLLFVSASAVGGLGSDGPPTFAGTSQGGTATVEAFALEGSGGTVGVDGAIFVFADGGSLLLPPGAFGSEGQLLINSGGTGEGGSVNVLVRGGSIASPALGAFARGIGGEVSTPPFGNGRAGYAGTGGDVTIEFSDTDSNIGLLAATALGQGGAGSVGIATEGSSIGGAGGAGTGGSVDMLVQGGTTTIGNVTLFAPGVGGTGGAGGFQGLSPGGTGGLGTGGEVIVTAGAGGRLLTSSLSVDASGDGGVGGAGSFGFDVGGVGGAGGDGVGGLAQVGTTGGDIVISGVESELRIAAIGFGGTGGIGGVTTGDGGPGGDGGVGGDGTGGTAQIDIAGGSITTPRTGVDGSGSGGAGGSAGANPFFTGTSGADGNGEGGLSRIAVADGAVVPGSASLGFTFMSASGFSGSGFSTLADTAGLMVIADSASGDVLLDELEAISNGEASPDGPAFQFTSSNGPVEVSGLVTVDVVGDVDIAATGSGGLQAGGAVSVTSGGSILIDHQLRATDASTLSGASVNLTAQDDVTGNGDSLVTGTLGDVLISAATVDLGRITATRDLIIDAGNITFDFGTARRDITLDTGGNIDIGFAEAGDDFTASAFGAFTAGTVIATGLGEDTEVDTSSSFAGSNIEVFTFGDLRLDNGDAFDNLRLTSVGANVLSDGLLDAGAAMVLRAGSDTDNIVDILINDASAGTTMDLSATGGLVADTLNAGGTITGFFGTDVTVNSIGTGGSLLLFADGAVDLGTVVAADDVLVDPTSITIDSVTAGDDIDLDATGDITVGFAQAGDDFTANAGGIFTGGTVIVTGLGPDDEAGYGSGEGSNIFVDANGDLRLDNGSAPDTIDLASATGNVLSAGTLTANQLLISAALNIDLNDVDVVSSLFLSTSNGFIDGNNFSSDGGISLSASGGVTLAGADSGSFLFINAGGPADLGTLVSDSSITIFAPSILLDSATAAADINLDASGDILVGFAQAGDDFTASAGGIFTGGTVIATGLGPDNEAGYGSLEGANIVIDSNGNLTLTNGDAADAIRLTSFNASVLSTGLLDAGTDIDIAAVQTADLASLVAGNDITVDPVTIIIDSAIAGGDITLDASADITVGFAQAGDDFVANAGTTFTGTTVIAQGVKDSEAGVGPLGGGNIVVNAGTDLRLDNGNAADDIRLTSRAGSIFSSTLLTAGSDVVADAAQDIDVVTVDAGEFVSLSAGGFIDAASLIAGNSITSTSGGATTIAAADAGDSIFVSAGGAAALGTLGAGEDIFVDAASITLANGTAGSDISLGATGNIDVVSATVGDDFDANAGGTFNGTTIVATGGPDDDLIEGPFPGSNIIVDAVGDLRLDTGTAPDLIDLASSGGSIFSSGTLTADTLLAGAALDLLLNDVFVVTDLNLTTANGDIAGNSFNSDGNINLDSAGSVTLADADSGGDIDVAAGTNADLGTFVAAGDILVDATSIAFVSATAGGDVGLAASGDIGITFAQAGDDFVANAGGAFTGGTVTVTGSGTDSEGGAGALAGSNIQVDANGNLRLDNGTAPGAIDLASATGSILSSGTLTADRLVADAALDIALSNVSVVADLALTTPGGSISGNSFDSGGDISLDAAGSVTLAAADSGGNIVVAAGTTATLGTFVAAGDIVVDANGNVRLDNGTAAGTIDLASATASVLSSGTLVANRLLVDAAEDIALNNVDVVAALVLTAANGSISGNSFESDGNISLDAADDVVLAAADSGGALLIAAGGTADLGTLTAATDIGVDAGQINLAGATAGRDITLDAAGDIDVGNAQAGRNFTADAGGDGAFTNLTAGSVAISVLGNASFDGAVRAPTISVVSSDIDVAGTASIGDSATQLVTLTALATGQPTVLGGSTEGPGYTLTDAEANRVTSALFQVQAPQNGSGANRPADVLVRDLSLSGQRIGTFALFTGGIVQVEGGLLLSSVRSGGGIQIQAGERLQVVTPTGSIRVRDAAGLTDGTLTIASNNIWAADQALLAQLLADPNFTGRDQALLTNDGPVELRGYLEAGDVTLSARDTLFVQNSGSLISFAGITVRQNTLRIVPTGSQPLRVFAFGRRINPDGSFVTNTPFFAEVEFEGRGGAVGYTDESQFNLCFINSGVCRLPSPDQTLPGGPEIIEEPVDGPDDGARDGGSPPNNELVDTSFADEPLIEEPVTSGGDSILWDCDNDDDGDCDEEDYDG